MPRRIPRRSALPWRRASRPGGSSPPTRWPRRSPTWRARWPAGRPAWRWPSTAVCPACGCGRRASPGSRPPAAGTGPRAGRQPVTKIVGFETHDIRFPTSANLDGSDAMNPAPDYSAAYLVVRTDGPDGLAGHAHVFTIGRGNDIQLGAVRALEPFLAGRDVDDVLGDLGGLSRELVGDSQLRWLGPERGVVHMAIGAVLNACWDLAAKRAGQPLWELLAGLSPTQLVDLVDFRYLADALTRAEAIALLEHGAEGKAGRIDSLRRDGYPAYTTTPGWLGYTDEHMVELCKAAKEAGFTQVKLKVGASLTDDQRRLKLARAAVGDDVAIAVDANQVWDVPTAIDWMRQLAPFNPAWIEEPTSPDDILGTASAPPEWFVMNA